MADIAGLPFLEYLLFQCSNQNIDHVVLAVGYKYEVIQKHFGDSFNNITISYSIEKEALGTGGAIALALELCIQEDVLILNGDSITDANFNRLYQVHLENDKSFTVLGKEMKEFDRYGTLEINGNKIQQFIEKSYNKKGLINSGIYILNKEKFLGLSFPPKFSMEQDFMEAYVSKWKFNHYATNGFFIDIGIPQDYQKAQTKLPEIFNKKA